MRPTRSALLPSCNFSTVIFAAPILGIILVSSALIGPMAQAQSRPILITQAVDESKLVTLAGNTRPEANKQNDRGLVPDSLSLEHVMLQLKRSPAQEWALLQYIEELQLRTSPDYHRWLTAKQFGQRFGLAPPCGSGAPARNHAISAAANVSGGRALAARSARDDLRGPGRQEASASRG